MPYQFLHIDSKMGNKLLCVAELATALGHHPNQVYRMRSVGFPMPANTATPDEAMTWFIDNPQWRKGIVNEDYTFKSNVRDGNTLFYSTELAHALLKHPSYVYSMRAAGFPMPDDKSTVNSARNWLIDNPSFRKK